ncbi:MAG: histidine kinase [Ruminococcus sp.]|uniref:sensor histidine kinase n=1 Tax=Ruminococcus sp. TaxID=41978 RepID=UPI002873B487|nr:histidine kinase [Ruminococcus sp.]MBQ3286043.1 histidine kinase [Ruminococcus sp.]
MTEQIVSYSILGALVIMMVLGIVFSAMMPVTDRWSKRYFVTLFSLLLICSVICFLATLFWEDPRMATAERIVYFFEGLSLSSLMFMPTIILLHSCGESLKSSLLFKAVAALLAVYYIMFIVGQFADAVYCVTPDNQYIRGPLFALWLSPLVVIMILNIAGVIKRRQKLSKRYFIGLLVYMIPMTVSLLFHMFLEAEIYVVLCMALFAFVMFGLILADNMERFMQQQREIANQRAELMVLQMRPHFISNTMMGIYYLCDQDPQKAKQVTLDFTTYLRKNFTAIASEDTVPFTAELEHTRAYLAVEQAQFEDDLIVNFDTPHTMFRVPPLTLQPIVENAVKHGMSTTKEPLHISVVTRKTDNAIEIIVEDNGAGYAPADDNEPHIALSNIRRRLDMMCKGKLEITPREGGGTSVKVTIPDQANE